ncbi:MAG: plastocyanin/azurin family copper-binding protein [Cyclobacteriaceae bacterium]
MIVHTKFIGGGESDTITFEAPSPGTYDYICSFPGHYALMQGKLIVE